MVPISLLDHHLVVSGHLLYFDLYTEGERQSLEAGVVPSSAAASEAARYSLVRPGSGVAHHCAICATRAFMASEGKTSSPVGS